MSRIETRENVVIFIYQAGFRKEPVEEQLEIYKENFPSVVEDAEYFDRVCLGVFARKEELDETISKFLKKWTLKRLPRIDLAILEASVYEIQFYEDIPTSVTINEAVKLSKKYGTEDSSAFINGLLSSFEKSL